MSVEKCLVFGLMELRTSNGKVRKVEMTDTNDKCYRKGRGSGGGQSTILVVSFSRAENE